MRVKRIAGAVCLLVASYPASAKDICATTTGETVTPKSFDQVVLALPKPTAPKGEFESTADYEARLTAANSNPTQVLLARPVDEQTFPQPIEYDADHHVFKVRTSAFDWGTAQWSIQFALGKPAGVDAGVLFNVATVIRRTVKPLGAYRGSNAFGASAVISRQARITDSLWVRPAKSRDDKMFRGDVDDVLGTISMEPSEAKLAKSKIKFALAITPKPPFLVSGTGPGNLPTLDDPRKIPLEADRFRVLVADVECGLVLDGSNKVVGVFPAAK